MPVFEAVADTGPLISFEKLPDRKFAGRFLSWSRRAGWASGCARTC